MGLRALYPPQRHNLQTWTPDGRTTKDGESRFSTRTVRRDASLRTSWPRPLLSALLFFVIYCLHNSFNVSAALSTPKNSTKVVANLQFGRSFAALTPLDARRVLISGGQKTRVFSSNSNGTDISEDDGGPLFTLYDAEMRSASALPVSGVPSGLDEVLWSHAALLDDSGSRVWIVFSSGVAHLDLSARSWNLALTPEDSWSPFGTQRWFYFGAAWGQGTYRRWIFVAGGNVHSRGQWAQKRLFAAFDTEKAEWHDLSSSPAALTGTSEIQYVIPPDATRHYVPFDRSSMVRMGRYLVLYTVSELFAFDLKDPKSGWANITGLVSGDPAAPPAIDRETNTEYDKVPYTRKRIFAGMVPAGGNRVLLYGGLGPTGRALTADLWLLTADGPPAKWHWRMVISHYYHPKDDHNPFRRWAMSLAYMAERGRVVVWGGVSGIGMGMGRVGAGDGDAAVRELNVASDDVESWTFIRIPLPPGQAGEGEGVAGHEEEFANDEGVETQGTRTRSSGLLYVLGLLGIALPILFCIYRLMSGRSGLDGRLRRVPSRASRIVPTKISFVPGAPMAVGSSADLLSVKRRGSDSSMSSVDDDILPLKPPTPQSGTPMLNVGGSPLRGVVGRQGLNTLHHLHRGEGTVAVSPAYFGSPRTMSD